MKCKLNDYQYKLYNKMLNENAESDSQKKAIQYLMDNYDFDKEEAEKYVRVTLRDKLRILTNNKKVGKFTLGALRLYFEDCKKDKDVRNLYNILNAISEDNEIGKKYDRNFNNKSLSQLVKEIEPKEVDRAKEDYDSSKFKTKYKIYKINTFEKSKEFAPYVSWCVTKSDSSLASYNDNYKSQFYFAVVDGFDKMKEADHMDEQLLGEYGLSMLAICVNPYGELKSCTCRWNHDKGGGDHCMNVEEIQKVVGVNFKEAFPPNEWGKEAIEQMDNIEDLIYSKTFDQFIEYVRKEYHISYTGRFYINDIRIKTNCHRSHNIINVNGLYNYIYNTRGDDIILKCCAESDENCDTFIMLHDDIIYKDIKYNCFSILSLDDYSKHPMRKVVSMNYIEGDHSIYDMGDIICLNEEGASKLYDADYTPLCSLKDELPDFKELLVITANEDDNYDTLNLLDISYADTKGKTRHAVYNCYDNYIYEDAQVRDAYSKNYFIMYDKSEKPKGKYSVIIDGQLIEGLEDYDSYIKDSESPTGYTFIFLNMGKKYKIYEYSSCLGDFKNYKEFRFNGDEEENGYITFFGFTNDDKHYDISIYKEGYNSDDVDDLWDEKNVTIVSFGGDVDSEIEFVYRNADGDLYYVKYDGDKYSFDDLKDEIEGDFPDACREVYDAMIEDEEFGKEYVDDNYGSVEDFIANADPTDNDLEQFFMDTDLDIDKYRAYAYLKKFEE